MVTVRLLRRLAGRGGPGSVVEIRASVADDLLRRRLVELIEEDGGVPQETQQIEPEETQQAAGPRELKPGVVMTYRDGRGPSFGSREEMEAHRRETAGKAG